jgi:hypothetical protein
MDRNQKVISYLPVEELWAGQRLVSTIKVRDLDASYIVDLLRSGVVRFVVADIGKPYEWIPNNERYDFWKNEVKAHLAAPESKSVLEMNIATLLLSGNLMMATQLSFFRKHIEMQEICLVKGNLTSCSTGRLDSMLVKHSYYFAA